MFAGHVSICMVGRGLVPGTLQRGWTRITVVSGVVAPRIYLIKHESKFSRQNFFAVQFSLYCTYSRTQEHIETELGAGPSFGTARSRSSSLCHNSPADDVAKEATTSS